MNKILISDIKKGSIAEEAGVEKGDFLFYEYFHYDNRHSDHGYNVGVLFGYRNGIYLIQQIKNEDCNQESKHSN